VGGWGRSQVIRSVARGCIGAISVPDQVTTLGKTGREPVRGARRPPECRDRDDDVPYLPPWRGGIHLVVGGRRPGGEAPLNRGRLTLRCALLTFLSEMLAARVDVLGRVVDGP
jgi:hypothetical protein